MTRTINEIQQSILDAKQTATNLSALEVLTTSEQTLNSANSTSKVSIWRLWVWIFAYALQVHERIVERNAQNSRPHTIRWYREQCLNFLDGLALTWLNGQFQYDLTNVTDADVRKIIDRCAVLESNNGELVIKIATDNAGVIEPVTPAQLVRFKAYCQQIKDAGNRIRVINQSADLLKIGLTVYVDPLIIDLQTGKLLSAPGNIFPVKNAITNYLASLEFNGSFVKTFFQDALQKAEGVNLPIIDDLQSQYAGFNFVLIAEWRIPEAGYFAVNDVDLTIIYKAYDLAGS
ncbi:hypothetical protein [Flavobacterium psychrophilum]|uniref:hypothetical protein n=1 Tax=Flavobacterium psychrophilum TaxID=96345 RepID=UPI000B7C1E54|nr:hypothetical protein [Flavobacterium psychrophilum]SNA66928.1 conserved hypothetical protein [Flavobacterium psychrophilum]SNB07475.1 conserved hypothetical protein [Flavobacterium psychrophilum]